MKPDLWRVQIGQRRERSLAYVARSHPEGCGCKAVCKPLKELSERRKREEASDATT